MNKKIVITGSVCVVLAIIFGAFGAHALKNILDSNALMSFETGVRYQMYHGLGFLLLGMNSLNLPKLNAVYRLLLSGVVLFSGSIYLLVLEEIIGVNMSYLGPVTPVGGVLLITGWSLFIFQLLKSNKKNQE